MPGWIRSIEGAAHGRRRFMACTSTGSSSSGSEHEPSSVCLAAMVDEFMEEEANSSCKDGSSACSSTNSHLDHSQFHGIGHNAKSSIDEHILRTLKELVSSPSKMDVAVLAAASQALSCAAQEASFDGEGNGNLGCMKRLVMKHLKRAAYNAAVCKSRWPSAGAMPAGDYDYIDVVLDGGSSSTERIIVDIDFRTQFEIARPTSTYRELLECLPSMYVGNSERLQKIINVICEAVKQSVKVNDMHLPPWRRSNYLKAKWFSAYRRTSNECSNSASSKDDGLDHRIGKRNDGLMAISATVTDWELPAVAPKQSQRLGKGRACLASVLRQSLMLSNVASDAHHMHHPERLAKAA